MAGEPNERRTEVIREERAGPAPPPGGPRWRDPGPWLVALGVLVLAGIGLIVLLQAMDDDDGEADQGGPATVTTVATSQTETVITTTEAEPEQVSVPDAIGTDHVEAGAEIDAAGLVADTYPVSTIRVAPGQDPGGDPRGTVVAQNPDPNTRLTEGDHVRLNVSTGPATRPTGEIPDVTGPAGDEARARCREANFTCRTVERSAPSPEEVGEAIDQAPAAGTSAEVLTQITLFVGR
jgi:beta-lactam-binding protein with PASTA domain